MHVLHHPPHQRRGTERAGHDARAQAAQVEVVELGMIQHGGEHRRHPVQGRAALRLDRLQRGQRVEPLARKHHLRAIGHGREVPQHHAETVIERHRNAERILRCQPHRTGGRNRVVEDAPVAQRRPLRPTRRSRRELDVDRVLGLQRDTDGVEPRLRPRPAPRHHIVEGERARHRIGTELHHAAQFRQLCAAQLSGTRLGQFGRQFAQLGQIVAVAESRRGDQRADAGVPERVFQLPRLVGGIDVDQDRPDPRRRELRQKPLGPVGRPDADSIAPVDTDRQQSGRKPVHLPREVVIGPPLPRLGEHRGRTVAVPT